MTPIKDLFKSKENTIFVVLIPGSPWFVKLSGLVFKFTEFWGTPKDYWRGKHKPKATDANRRDKPHKRLSRKHAATQLCT